MAMIHLLLWENFSQIICDDMRRVGGAPPRKPPKWQQTSNIVKISKFKQ